MNRKYSALCFLCLAGTFVGLYQWREARIRHFSPPSADEMFASVDRKYRQEAANLLPVGSSAPDFALTTSEGNTLSLNQARQSRKAILVHFGFINCGPCQKELPFLVALHTRLQRKGLTIIAVDTGDTRSALAQWMAHNRVRFPVAMAGEPHGATGNILHQYHITNYPTNYLIDAIGRIVWREVGTADESVVLAALAHSNIL